MNKFFVILYGADSENTCCSGPFAQLDAIERIRQMMEDNPLWVVVDDFLDEAVPFIRFTIEDGDEYELHVSERHNSIEAMLNCLEEA